MTVWHKRFSITGCIVMIILLGCAIGWERRRTANARIVISFSHFETHNETLYAVIEVRNVGTATASCYGYDWERPFYYVVFASGTNWSWNDSPGFDLERIRPIEVPPGRSMPVRTATPYHDQWMIGVPYSDASMDEKLPRNFWSGLQQLRPFKKLQSISWSKPLTRQSKPANIAAPLPDSQSEKDKANQKKDLPVPKA